MLDEETVNEIMGKLYHAEPNHNFSEGAKKFIANLDNLVCSKPKEVYVLRLLNGYDEMPEMEVFSSKKESFEAIRSSVIRIINTIDFLPRKSERKYEKVMDLSRRMKHPIAIMTAFNDLFDNTDYNIKMDLIRVILE